MTFTEWVLEVHGIEIKKTQMPIPTYFIGYTEYCRKEGIEEDWHN